MPWAGVGAAGALRSLAEGVLSRDGQPSIRMGRRPSYHVECRTVVPLRRASRLALGDEIAGAESLRQRTGGLVEPREPPPRTRRATLGREGLRRGAPSRIHTYTVPRRVYIHPTGCLQDSDGPEFRTDGVASALTNPSSSTKIWSNGRVKLVNKSATSGTSYNDACSRARSLSSVRSSGPSSLDVHGDACGGPAGDPGARAQIRENRDHSD